ncbi:MAG: glucose-6-phosphate isomerase [Actinomycetota bacterium]
MNRLEQESSLGALSGAVEERASAAERDDIVARMWRKDHTVWKPSPAEISDRLGWLDVVDAMRDRVVDLIAFRNGVLTAGFTHALLLGMGGSSLAPEVMRRVLGVGPEGIDLRVLDTTHPGAIRAAERSLDLDHTLFIVASKSGGTIETLSHLAYFWEKVGRGERFVAITDPGSPLEELARARGFRAVFANPPDIGGRYSALSLFGLVPAALLGASFEDLLGAATEAAGAAHAPVSKGENQAAWLGAVMGEAAARGRDKLTLVLSPEASSFGAWVEQLIAESTGKQGLGILPVTGEDLGPASVYGDDRLFVTLGEIGDLADLAAAGHPIVRLDANGPLRLGREFYRWEFATAFAGYVLGINPFDQPNVAEAKQATGDILKEGTQSDDDRADVAGVLNSVGAGDYVALLAFVEPSAANVRALHRARMRIRDRFRVATTVGFGPRYLHSTGQLHKGGPDSGVFIQVTDDIPPDDLDVPGAPYTFGRLIEAQALGDFRSLRARGRRVARATLSELDAAL